jgi:hypothetical protein
MFHTLPTLSEIRMTQDAELRTVEYATVAQFGEAAQNVQQLSDLRDIFSQINAEVKGTI